ncbi:MAG: hypothetical protein SGPRY_011337 [Prymnesium sp.]
MGRWQVWLLVSLDAVLFTALVLLITSNMRMSSWMTSGRSHLHPASTPTLPLQADAHTFSLPSSSESADPFTNPQLSSSMGSWHSNAPIASKAVFLASGRYGWSVRPSSKGDKANGKPGGKRGRGGKGAWWRANANLSRGGEGGELMADRDLPRGSRGDLIGEGSSLPTTPPPVAAKEAGQRAAPSNRSGGIPLHKNSRVWLERCVNGTTLNEEVANSEYWRQRRHYIFYKHLPCIVWRYAAKARSVVDVGSAVPPFVNTLAWIENKTILGPRFAGNVAKGGSERYSFERIETKYAIFIYSSRTSSCPDLKGFVVASPSSYLTQLFVVAHFQSFASQADFLDWPSTHPAVDLVLCFEPEVFVRKLLLTAPVVVLSVHSITREMISGWAGRQPDAYDLIKEASGEQRIVCVYRSSAGAP